MRHKETGELLPLFVQVEDLSVLPLGTISSAPPAHCVPADLVMTMEFQPELHCRIAELDRALEVVERLMPAQSLTDPDLKLGLGFTAGGLTP